MSAGQIHDLGYKRYVGKARMTRRVHENLLVSPLDGIEPINHSGI